MSFCLIILAGGKSHRFKSNISKPYQKLGGKSLLEINVIKARQIKKIKKIIVIYNKKDSKRVKSLKLKAWGVWVKNKLSLFFPKIYSSLLETIICLTAS